MPAEILFANAHVANASALDMGEPNLPRISKGGIIFSPRMMSAPKPEPGGDEDEGGGTDGGGVPEGECACGWVN